MNQPMYDSMYLIRNSSDYSDSLFFFVFCGGYLEKISLTIYDKSTIYDKTICDKSIRIFF